MQGSNSVSWSSNMHLIKLIVSFYFAERCVTLVDYFSFVCFWGNYVPPIECNQNTVKVWTLICINAQICLFRTLEGTYLPVPGGNYRHADSRWQAHGEKMNTREKRCPEETEPHQPVRQVYKVVIRHFRGPPRTHRLCCHNVLFWTEPFCTMSRPTFTFG